MNVDHLPLGSRGFSFFAGSEPGVEEGADNLLCGSRKHLLEEDKGFTSEGDQGVGASIGSPTDSFLEVIKGIQVCQPGFIYRGKDKKASNHGKSLAETFLLVVQGVLKVARYLLTKFVPVLLFKGLVGEGTKGGEVVGQSF